MMGPRGYYHDNKDSSICITRDVYELSRGWGTTARTLTSDSVCVYFLLWVKG